MNKHPVIKVKDGTPQWEGHIEDGVYQLRPFDSRSSANHKHYFATIKHAFNLLHDGGELDRWPNPEELRKWALVKAGYSKYRELLAVDENEARVIATALLAGSDDVTLAVADGCMVRVWAALSQSVDRMSNRQFHKSKQDVIDVLAELCGCSSAWLAEGMS